MLVVFDSKKSYFLIWLPQIRWDRGRLEATDGESGRAFSGPYGRATVALVANACPLVLILLFLAAPPFSQPPTPHSDASEAVTNEHVGRRKSMNMNGNAHMTAINLLAMTLQK